MTDEEQDFLRAEFRALRKAAYVAALIGQGLKVARSFQGAESLLVAEEMPEKELEETLDD